MTYPNTVISMPSQLFTMARSFKACSNGNIYIGMVDTDPTIPENQIQVYLENEDGSQVPVPQPIKINTAGYPVYNGQIAKFVANQAHSMAVYDAYNAQQFYFPDVYKFNPIAPSLEYIDLTTVARSNNVNVDQVAYLKTGIVAGILYFYDKNSQVTYRAKREVTGNVTGVGTPSNGVIDLTVSSGSVSIVDVSFNGNDVFDDFSEIELFSKSLIVGDVIKISDGREFVVSNSGIDISNSVYLTPVNMPDYNDIKCLAHRGFRNQASQENTLLAFQQAIESGADIVEMDLSVSSDGVVYVYHDTNVDDLTNGTGKFTDLNSSYIDSLKYTGLDGTTLEGERITRYLDVLKWISVSGSKVSCEIKGIRSNSDCTIIAQMILDAGCEYNVELDAFDFTRLEKVKDLSGDIKVGWLTSLTEISDELNALAKWKNSRIVFDRNIAKSNQNLIKDANDVGVVCAAYTAIRKNDAIELYSIGITEVISEVLVK